MNEDINTGTNSTNDENTATYKAVKRLTIPESLLPVKNIPELLVENRRICMEMAKQVMQQMAMLSSYFGVPLLEVIFDCVPEEAEHENLAADGIREAAAAKSYFDFKGALSLTDLCKGPYASKVPALRLASVEMVERGGIRKMCHAEFPFKVEREDDMRAQEASPSDSHAQEGTPDATR